MLRTNTCGELNEEHIDKTVTLAGWVHTRRDHGEVIFLDLRDAYGVTQLVFNPEDDRLMHDRAHELKSEYVIRVEGLVRKRPEGTINEKLSTGRVEVVVKTLEILNSSLTPPFEVDDNMMVADETRLKYRYIDLRRPLMQRNMRLRHAANSVIRNFLESKRFVEIETPFLTRSTPEGARDFLVPSRLNVGKFYALPQSPQLFKQILMVAGFDRYFQIVRCFRDEDLRRDRQPEFTQLDMEMSFVTEEDIFDASEGLMKELFRKLSSQELNVPFHRLKYHEAMEKYGTDKPDTRFGMELSDLTTILKDTKFNVFKKTLESGGRIYAICVEDYAAISRSRLDGLIGRAKELGAKGLAYFKCESGKLTSNIDKYFDEKELSLIKEAASAKDGSLILIVADEKNTALNVLGDLRLEIAGETGMIDKNRIEPVWITDFPLFKYNKEENRWESEHHPFTACRDEDIELLGKGSELDKIRARSYDLVINGSEIASGSIRIHKKELQAKIFDIIGLGEKEAERRFGFLIEAFKYGAPPHGGIAFGLDRFLTIFTGSSTIRDVISFPKTQKAVCPMTNAPSDVDEKQLKELHIKKKS